MDPVCLVIGAGAGIGGTVASRFAAEGYHACLSRRSNEEGLKRLVQGIQEEGGKATGFILNAIEENAIEKVSQGVRICSTPQLKGAHIIPLVRNDKP